MHNLLHMSKLSGGQKSIFSDIITISFYDGPTEAICETSVNNEWVLASLIYFNPPNRERIFSIIEIAADWLNKFKLQINAFKEHDFRYFEEIKKEIRRYYKTYTADVWLYKGESLASSNYQIVQIESGPVQYFDHIEKVIKQNKKSQLKWQNAFAR